MASRREEQQESVRFHVIRTLNENPEMSTRGLAEAVGVSNGSAYCILKALVDKGFVKLTRFNNNPKRVQYAYLLAPKGVRERLFLTHRFIDYEREEFEGLTAEIEILEDEVGFAGSIKLVSELKND